MTVAVEICKEGGDLLAKITLKAARVNAGLSQDGLAERLGVSSKMIVEWELGKSEMRPAYLLAICYITGFSEDDIILPSEYSKNEQET